MNKKQRQFSHEDKYDLVIMLIKDPSKADEICEKYNIGKSTLYKWRSRFLEGGRQELDDHKTGPKPSVAHASKNVSLKQTIRDYEKRISELACENEILKKNENWTEGPLL